MLDEPLLGLSPIMEEILVTAVEDINRSMGLTIILAEQYARPVFPIISYGYVLENGGVVVEGLRRNFSRIRTSDRPILGWRMMRLERMSDVNELVMDGFYRACEKHSERAALIYLGEKITYRELKEYIQRFATALHDLGVRKDDKIMLYIPNCPQFIICYLAAQIIGGVPVPVSPIYTPSELRYLIRDSGATTILCLDTNLRYVKEILHETGLQRIIVTTYVEMLPLYKKAFGIIFDKVPTGATERGKNLYRFSKLLRSYPADPPRVDVDPTRQLCYILYTGGTTGFPKGCISTHLGMVSFINEIKQLGGGARQRRWRHFDHGQSVVSPVGSGYDPGHGPAQGQFGGPHAYSCG